MYIIYLFRKILKFLNKTKKIKIQIVMKDLEVIKNVFNIKHKQQTKEKIQ
jgi:hypothetical protein